MLTPIRRVAGGRTREPAEFRHAADEHNTTEASAPTAAIDWRRLGPSVIAWFIYRLFNGTSSTIDMQNPWGLTLVAFFTILIFIVIS